MKTKDIQNPYKQLRLVTAIKQLSVAHCIAAASLTVTAPTVFSAENVSSILEEVVVTARKRDESAQAVPISLNAYNSDQLDALKMRDLQSLSMGMPNVALDDAGSAKGIANFSIRGLGINSTIPSIDPTVGIFKDGVYQGQNAGMVFDTFDLESVEVLRGVQGTLFGRNVTGGAILMNTKKPSKELAVEAKVAVEGNPNGDGGLSKYLMGSVSGPVVSDVVLAKLALYGNDDDGWFVNEFDGSDFGASETRIIRPAITFLPSESLEITLRYEHTTIEGDGPASQSHTNGRGVPGVAYNADRDSHDFSIDEPGEIDVTNKFAALELNWDIGFGDGRITSITGYREYDQTTYGDIDSQPIFRFHSGTINLGEEKSTELRYNGTFGRANVTTGLYWFNNEIEYQENRSLAGVPAGPGGSLVPFVKQDGGGLYEVETYSAFGSVDFNLTDALTLTAGIRYTEEKKSAEIATLTLNTTVLTSGIDNTCSVIDRSCAFDFVDDETWTAWSPKLGLSYELSDSQRVYGLLSQGQRSGGYNLRNSAIDTVNNPPGPFDEETVSNFEVGYKSELAGGGTFNAAVFYNEIKDMQREINQADIAAGVVQLIRNTADAEIWGIELDGTVPLTDQLLLQASVGWTDASYTDVSYDLNEDGVINGEDKGLDLPRAAELTYRVGLVHDLPLGDAGSLTSRISYAYRDEAAYTDSNLGYLLEQEILDASIDFMTADGRWVASLFGRNLLDDVKHGGDTQLPNTVVAPSFPVGGTFAPLMKGRVVGVELSYRL